MGKLIISRCLQKEIYIILRPFNIADEAVIRCVI